MPGYDSRKWRPRPKSLTERGYRNHMAKQTKVTINGTEYTLQSVSPSWYMEQNDKYGMTGSGKRDTSKYMDIMFRNVVVTPAEVAQGGMTFFDQNDDIKTAVDLLKEIESFLYG